MGCVFFHVNTHRLSACHSLPLSSSPAPTPLSLSLSHPSPSIPLSLAFPLPQQMMLYIPEAPAAQAFCTRERSAGLSHTFLDGWCPVHTPRQPKGPRAPRCKTGSSVICLHQREKGEGEGKRGGHRRPWGSRKRTVCQPCSVGNTAAPVAHPRASPACTGPRWVQAQAACALAD